LIESDERWKTVYSVWLHQVKFSGYPSFKIFWIWEALQPEPDQVFSWDMFQKFRNLITFPKQAHSLRYSTGNLQK
jgi:hypothetical protein